MSSSGFMSFCMNEFRGSLDGHPVTCESCQYHQELWRKLAEGIGRIYRQEETLNCSRFMQYYSYVYNYCTNSQKKVLYDSGQELYYRLKDFLEQHLFELQEIFDYLSDEESLEFYVKHWEEFSMASKALNRVCVHLNRFWVQVEQRNGRIDIHEMYKLALVLWHEHLFLWVGCVITSEVVKLTERDRYGETVDLRLVTGVVNCYVELGQTLEGPNATEHHLCLYKEHFETPLVENVEASYKQKIADFLKTNSAVEYMNFAEQQLRKEWKFAQEYLHESSQYIFITTCEQVLIHSQMEVFQAAFQNLLDTNNDSYISRLYSLVGRTAEGYIMLQTTLEAHIHNQGIIAIEVALRDPNLYVHNIMAVHKKYQMIISSTLNNDGAFVAALDRACVKFINTHGVTGAELSPIVLAKYCDSLLKKCLNTPEAVELSDALYQLMILFKYIEDKDAFQRSCSKLLVKRLCNYMDANNEVKASITSKLLMAFSFEYTSMLRCMFQDILCSSELNENYKQLANDANIDINALLLSSTFYQPNSNEKLTLPLELNQYVSYFSNIYGQYHSTRKLTWLYSMCRGELTANCFRRQYTLQVSTFQMTILLQFNKQTSWNVHQLSKNTGIDHETLIQTLRVLLKTKLLQSSHDETSLQPTSTVDLNIEFYNANPNININIPTDPELSAQQQEAHVKQLQEKTLFVIRATIVRIMKQRRTLSHSELVAEVLQKLPERFKPKARAIKKGIDVLIEKEYLERSEGQLDIYSYVD